MNSPTSSLASALLIDVRSPLEFSSGHVDGALNLPLDQFVERYAQLAPDKQQAIIVYCASGGRSGQAAQFLAAQGYSQVFNGISAAHVAGQLGRSIV